MEKWCSVVWTTVCVTPTFQLPVVEILAMAVVSGLVTWATVHFSLKAAAAQTDRAIAHSEMIAQQALDNARAETDRMLENDRMREVRAAITTLAYESGRLFDNGASGLNKSVQAMSSIDVLRRSGLPNCATIADWSKAFIDFSLTLTKTQKHRLPELGFDGMQIALNGPGDAMLRQLGSWAQDPAADPSRLVSDTRSFESRVKAQNKLRMADFMAKHGDKTMAEIAREKLDRVDRETDK